MLGLKQIVILSKRKHLLMYSMRRRYTTSEQKSIMEEKTKENADYKPRKKSFSQNSYQSENELSDLNTFEKLILEKYGGNFVSKLRTSTKTRDLKLINRTNYNIFDSFPCYDGYKMSHKYTEREANPTSLTFPSFNMSISNFSNSKFLEFHKAKIMRIPNPFQSPSLIPKLANNLDKILNIPGIFPTESINRLNQGKLGDFYMRLPQYSEIDDSCISQYNPPSHDSKLIELAKRNECKYLMSTSTIASVMSHMYYTISNYKSPHFTNLSEPYDREPLKFMVSQRKPSSVFLRMIDKEQKIYAIDSDSGFAEPSNIVLLKMGKYMEKMIQNEADDFRGKYIIDPKTGKPKKTAKVEEDYFKYSKINNLMLRSQIDCQGVNEKGEPIVFEIKTRSAAVLRYDIVNYIDYLGYEIIKRRGKHSSFEREYYDLIRGGFLRYIAQCKIGDMDGAFVAYHNTQRVFGFEYIKLKEMEERVFGCSEFSDQIFKASLVLIEKVLDYILTDMGENSKQILKLGFYANEQRKLLDIFVEIFEDEEEYKERTQKGVLKNSDDALEYYSKLKIKPRVIRYVAEIYTILNGLKIDYSPILYEKGDYLEVKYNIGRYGLVPYDEYLKFLHEAYKSFEVNIDNEYTGTWSFAF